MQTKSEIVGAQVSVQLGDIGSVKVEALVVPEFAGGGTHGGVRLALIRRYGVSGFEAFDAYCAQNGDTGGDLPFGEVVLTKSGGSPANYFLHCTTVGSGRENEFGVVKSAMAKALKIAEESGIESIAVPALGTGIIGDLTARQSAEAMMSAIKEHRQQGGKEVSVDFVIYGDNGAYRDFVSVMQSETYAAADASQKGDREFDMMRWVAGMHRAEADQKVIFNQQARENAPTAREFSLGAVIAAYHGVVTSNSLVPVYELFEYLIGQPVFYTDISAAQKFCMPVIAAQFPDIAKIDATMLPTIVEKVSRKGSEKTNQAVAVWLCNQENAYGKAVRLTPASTEKTEQWPMFRERNSALRADNDVESRKEPAILQLPAPGKR